MHKQEIFDESLGADALIINYNKLSLSQSSEGNFLSAQEMLNKAYSLLPYSSKTSFLLLKSMTLNNLASFFLKQKDPENALKCLQEVVSSNFPGSKTNLAITLINIATIESSQGDHDQAMRHIQSSITILKESPNMTFNIINSLIIAYHNYALECRNLGEQAESHKYMREAWELSLEQLGPDNKLTHIIFRGLNEESSTGGLTHVKIFPNTPIIKPINRGEKKLEQILGKKPRNSSIGNYEFQNVRFLTGDRLQPMHKIRTYRKVCSRPGSRTANSAIASRTLKKKHTDPQKQEESEFPITEKYPELAQFVEKSQIFEEKFEPLNALSEQSEEYLSSKASAIPDKRLEIHKILEETQQQAAINIQKHMKAWRDRQKYKEKAEGQKSAASTISRAFKGFLAREIIKDEKGKCYVIPEVESDKELETLENEKGIENIEKEIESIKDDIEENNVEDEGKIESLENEKVEDIENCVEKKVKTKDESALIIQTAFKGFLGKKKYKKTISAVVKIQAMVRMWLVRTIYKSIKEAVVCIQANYRGYLVRKRIKALKNE
ncbi:hypothetical protein SteCoe_30812 [Stentor coeruleus]|uniref:Uncharacterized protein n=1 Tax=Stentor coeruleus TaxID=5963 RepID=A0A1R2B2T4_9CILI|nr:hypothetical protein SteCoe_30812 [Stentor coeruleus]